MNIVIIVIQIWSRVVNKTVSWYIVCQNQIKPNCTWMQPTISQNATDFKPNWLSTILSVFGITLWLSLKWRLNKWPNTDLDWRWTTTDVKTVNSENKCKYLQVFDSILYFDYYVWSIFVRVNVCVCLCCCLTLALESGQWPPTQLQSLRWPLNLFIRPA